MDLANAVLGIISSGVLAVFGYLAHHFVSGLRKEISELREENEAQGQCLVQIESDLNEAWLVIRQSTGKGGGRRKTRYANAWRKPDYVSRPWTALAREGSLERGIEEEDL